jgi:hypothetical protein
MLVIHSCILVVEVRRIVVIDQLRGHEKEPEMQISLDDVSRWMDAAGFQPIQQIPLFKGKVFVIFRRKS